MSPSRTLALCLCFAAALGVGQALAQGHELPPFEELPSFPQRAHWVPRLVEGLANDDPATRARCAFVLGQIGDPQAADPLRNALTDPDEMVHWNAAIALCQLGEAEGLPLADEALHAAPRWLRYYAAQALARLGTPEARQALRRDSAKQPPYIRRIVGDACLAEPAPLEPTAPEGAVVPEAWPDLFIEAGNIPVIHSDWYFHKGDYDQAIRANEAVAFLDPGHIEAWTNAAWLTWSQNRDKEADRIFEAGIAANPQSYEPLLEYAMFRRARQRFADAAELLRRASALDCPAHVVRLCGHTLAKAGKKEEALDWWRRAAKRFPDDAIIKRELARAGE